MDPLEFDAIETGFDELIRARLHWLTISAVKTERIVDDRRCLTWCIELMDFLNVKITLRIMLFESHFIMSMFSESMNVVYVPWSTYHYDDPTDLETMLKTVIKTVMDRIKHAESIERQLLNMQNRSKDN